FETDFMDTPLIGKIHELRDLAGRGVKALRTFKNEAGAFNIPLHISRNMLACFYRMSDMELLRVVILMPCLPKALGYRSRQSHCRGILACQRNILPRMMVETGNGSAEKSGCGRRVIVAIMVTIKCRPDTNHRFITD